MKEQYNEQSSLKISETVVLGSSGISSNWTEPDIHNSYIYSIA